MQMRYRALESAVQDTGWNTAGQAMERPGGTK